jgi:nucleoside-diphosphate-sugar epimerase
VSAQSVERADGVFHFAAIVDHSLDGIDATLRVNVDGTRNVLEAAKRRK